MDNETSLYERVTKVEVLTQTQQKEIDKCTKVLEKHEEELKGFKEITNIVKQISENVNKQTNNIDKMAETMAVMQDAVKLLESNQKHFWSDSFKKLVDRIGLGKLILAGAILLGGTFGIPQIVKIVEFFVK